MKRERHQLIFDCLLAGIAVAFCLWTMTQWDAPSGFALVFGLLMVLAANARVRLGKTALVKPTYLVALAMIVAGQTHGVTMAPIALTAFSLLDFRTLHGRKRLAAITASSNVISTAAAAGVVAIAGMGNFSTVALIATATWVFVDACTFCIGLAVEDEMSLRESAHMIAPHLLPVTAFGLIGAVGGELFARLGIASVPLVLLPAVLIMTLVDATLAKQSSHADTLHLFLNAIYVKDEYTGRHSKRVAKYAVYAAEELGYSKKRVTELYRGALLHDIGKVATPLRFLNKPGKLTEDEFAVVKEHNRICIDILWHVEFLRPVIEVAADKYGHFAHDHDDAHMDSHIVAVADAFDAMTSTRPYRKALPQAVAFQELRDKSGTQFNPRAAEALISAIERRGETYGAGHEEDLVDFGFEVPDGELGSAGLGNLANDANQESNRREAEQRFGVFPGKSGTKHDDMTPPAELLRKPNDKDKHG